MTTLRRVARAAAVLVLTGSTALAQVPDSFTNLQVLPKDIPKAELMSTMRGFCSALGVRCIHCHVGDDPNSLDKVDFVSDARETKKVARVMIQMTQRINKELLPGIGRASHLSVKCYTCHHGVTKPEAMDDKLLTIVTEQGVEDAAGKYRELRQKYFGQAAYDFSAGPLNSVAETLARKHNNTDAAVAMVKLNLEFNPNEAFSHLLLAQLLAKQGDKPAAIASLERCLEIEPDNRWAKQLLEQMRAQK